MSARPRYAWENKKSFAAAIVQASCRGYNTGDGKIPTIHWANPPGQGNLLICAGVLYDPGGHTIPSIVAAGWNVLQSVTPFFATFILYRYASASEPSIEVVINSPPADSTGAVWALSAWEITGVSGIIGTDITHSTLSDATQRGPVATITPGNIVTQANTKLALLSFVGYTTATGQTFSYSGGPVSDGVDYNSPNADIANGLFDFGSAAHQAVSNGGAVNPTFNTSGSMFWYYTLIELV